MTDISKIDMERIEGLISKLESMKYVVESWSEGTEWYRKWSDGWIEQGGYLSSTIININGTYTKTLHLPFSNTNYTIIVIPYTSYSGSFTGYDICLDSRTPLTVDTFSTHISVNNNVNKFWYACGY